MDVSYKLKYTGRSYDQTRFLHKLSSFGSLLSNPQAETEVLIFIYRIKKL